MIPILLLLVNSYELRAGVTPVQKVIAMMDEMAAKGKAEKEAEATQHAAYVQWCTDTSREKKKAIELAAAEVEKLSADGGKAEADAIKLADAVAALDAQIGEWQAEKADATSVREAEKADYTTVHNDYTENLDAMATALNTLAAKNVDVSALQVPRLTALLQIEQPEASAYEFHSGGIMDTVKGLQAKMQEENTALENEEAQKRHSFQLLAQQLTQDIQYATEERTAKAAAKAQRAGDGATARADASATQAAHDEDVAYLRKLTAQCQQKAFDFEARQKLRAEELEAIAKATEIISSKGVSGAATAHLPSFALLRSAPVSVVARRVAVFLQGRAERAQSRVLLEAAATVLASPFDKVKQMVAKLIQRLEEEAAEEAEHKGWCDGELNSNKQTRDKKTMAVELLTARSEQLNADIAKLSSEIAELNEQIAASTAAMREATANRQKEKKANAVAVADATAAIEAVEAAIHVLKDFYGSAASASALQLKADPADDAPASFDAPYRGMQSSSTGILGMLDVILSDFTRLKSETSAEEQEAADAYDSFSAESTADVDAKTATAKAKSNERTRKSKDLREAQKDLRNTQQELDSALQYYDELKPNCIEAQVSYADRVQRREEEIASLQEALAILGN